MPSVEVEYKIENSLLHIINKRYKEGVLPRTTHMHRFEKIYEKAHMRMIIYFFNLKYYG